MPRWGLGHIQKMMTVLGVITSNPGITTAEIREATGYGKQRCRNTLMMLLEIGHVRREKKLSRRGGHPDAYYIIPQ